jgi:hypothetical protein
MSLSVGPGAAAANSPIAAPHFVRFADWCDHSYEIAPCRDVFLWLRSYELLGGTPVLGRHSRTAFVLRSPLLAAFADAYDVGWASGLLVARRESPRTHVSTRRPRGARYTDARRRITRGVERPRASALVAPDVADGRPKIRLT